MMISDYHGGRRVSSPKQALQKHKAFEAMLEHAKEKKLDLIFGGDFGDHGANPTKQDHDFAEFRKIRERILPGIEPIFIRGNHDYGYSDDQIKEMVGECKIHPSLVYMHEPSRVLVTHGHILGLTKTVSSIDESRTPQELEDVLTEQSLDQDLKPSIIAYDMANLIEHFVESMGLSGLSAFWQRLFKHRQDLAKKIDEWSINQGNIDLKTWKLVASLLGSLDDVETASLLGKACGSWATLFGHTHEPMVVSKSENQTGGSGAQIVGNSGNVNRKNPSCIVATFPTVTVLRFSNKENCLKKSASVSLDEMEIIRYSGRFPKKTESTSVESRNVNLKTPVASPLAQANSK